MAEMSLPKSERLRRQSASGSCAQSVHAVGGGDDDGEKL